MNERKAAGWLRVLDIVFGLIAIILSAVVVAYQELAILTVIFILSFVLLVVGVVRIFGGVFAKYLSDGMRAVNVGIGILALALGGIALLFADLTTQVLIYILSFALLLNGIARLVIGGFAKAFPGWLRGFLVVVGLLTIVLSVFIFVSPGLGFLALVLMLSFTFLFNGIARVVQGITGTQETEL